jgi:hypothetical protein
MAREPQTRGESQLKGRVVCFPVCASVEQPCLATLFSPTAWCELAIRPKIGDTIAFFLRRKRFRIFDATQDLKKIKLNKVRPRIG